MKLVPQGFGFGAGRACPQENPRVGLPPGAPEATGTAPPSNSRFHISPLERFCTDATGVSGRQGEGPSHAPAKSCPVSLGRPPRSDPKFRQPVGTPQRGAWHPGHPGPRVPVRGRAGLTRASQRSWRLSWCLSPVCCCRGGSCFYSVGIRKHVIGRWCVETWNSATWWCVLGLSKVNNCQSH